MACAAVLVPGLLRSSSGTICSPAASLKLTSTALRHFTLTRWVSGPLSFWLI